jgi:leucyl-tRNA synthetase
LIYFRFWTKFLFDLGYLKFNEPAKKLVNQGKIGAATFKILIASIHQQNETSVIEGSLADGVRKIRLQSGEEFEFAKPVKQFFFSMNANPALLGMHLLNPIYAPLESVATEMDKHIIIPERFFSTDGLENSVLATVNGFYYMNAFYSYSPSLGNDSFVVEYLGTEKMSKSKFNTINPDDIIDKYGADCFRLYEMFLGPLQQHKPWDTKGIDGCSRFLKKLWNLFYGPDDVWQVTDAEPGVEEWKILHKAIKKITDDTEKLAFNTAVSAMMICVNELMDAGCHSKKILEPFLLLIHPYAPFITEFLWKQLGHENSLLAATNNTYPVADDNFLTEDEFEYPVAVNGKTRLKIKLSLDLSTSEIENAVLRLPQVIKFTEGRQPRKVIVVQGRMINVVV